MTRTHIHTLTHTFDTKWLFYRQLTVVEKKMNKKSVEIHTKNAEKGKQVDGDDGKSVFKSFWFL